MCERHGEMQTASLCLAGLGHVVCPGQGLRQAEAGHAMLVALPMLWLLKVK